MPDANVKRKLAAILSADVVGYSRLMADDEVATVDTLKRYRTAIGRVVEHHKGRIVNAPGDNILAEFASAVEAVQAAVAIQATVKDQNATLTEDRRMRFRVGVNLGEVIEEDDGTIYGDGVNIAARVEGLAEAEGICISSKVVEEVEGKLGFSFDFIGEQRVKNIDKPVRVYRVRGEPGERSIRSKIRKTNKRSWLVSMSVLAVAVLGTLLWWNSDNHSPSRYQTITASAALPKVPDGPSIAVLPFANLSSDARQDYFSDGITEDIISGLSRFRTIFVIGKDSTIRYKDSGASAREIGRELGVEFVLQGSVRRASDMIRISTSLVKTESAAVVWSDVFDRPLTAEGVFAIQDEITEQVVATLAGAFGVLDQAKYADTSGERSQTLASYECVLRAKKFYFTWTVDRFVQARSCLENVVNEEPDYADAWAWLALLVQEEYSNGFPEKPNSVERSLAYAQRAIELAPNNQLAWVAMVEHHFFEGDFIQQRLAVDRVIALNPNESFMVGAAGHYLCNTGDYERGLEILDRVKLLSPYHAWWIHICRARYHFDRKEYAESLSEWAKTQDVPAQWKFIMQAANLAYLGRLEEAGEALDAIRELDPGYIDRMYDDLRLYHWNDEQIAHLFSGLKKAGLNIQSTEKQTQG
jgi:adenylate cyclase